jgi:hypothetical protein
MLTAVTSWHWVASGHFLDRLRGMETLRIFGRGEAETDNIRWHRRISVSAPWKCASLPLLRRAGILYFAVDCPCGGLLRLLLSRRAGSAITARR